MSSIWSPAHMATFAKVVDLNGFTAAARALKVPKASVSRAIAELEQELGVKVLTRTTRRIQLTAAGEQLLPHCRAILAAVERVRQRAAELTELREGPLRVLADTTYGRVLLSPLVPRFLERFPDIPLEVELGEAADGSRTAGFDVVVRIGEDPDPQRISRVLGAPPAVLVATPGYLQKLALPVRPEELEQHELLTPDGGGPRYTLRLSQGSRRAEVTVRPKLAVNDPALVHAAAAAGLGIALLPEFLCRQGLLAQKLKQVLPDWELPEQAPICAIYPAALAQDRRVNALVDFLAASIVPALAR
ncbi:MAG: LysR family transcriptional regulator [Steroidobacteraceae bacterium]